MAKTVINLQKTIQIEQYEPLVLNVTREYDEVLNNEKLVKKVGQLGEAMMDGMRGEVKRWTSNPRNKKR
ncbi:hypothetical protein [Burkholderia phage BCSR5]|nr:hypothetical protein [Burkholderia phage BCSR5]